MAVPPAAWSVQEPTGRDGATQPPMGDAAPPMGDAAPPMGDAAPPMGDAAPPNSDAAPPMGDATPPPNDAAPPMGDAAPPPITCEGACQRLADCTMSDVDMVGCVQGCEADDPGRAACVLTTACDEVQSCFSAAPPDACQRACEQFIGCGFDIFGQAECVEVCQGHDAWRATCMLEAECDEISGCMSGSPPPSEGDCQGACERFIGCGFDIFEMEQCVQVCMGEDASRAICMLGVDCEGIVDCMRSPQ
ncbi:hypothetical protein KKF91_05660 [Myxococcota bacterium]|nr:hypothetical protein [Myxococcota bacterium]